MVASVCTLDLQEAGSGADTASARFAKDVAAVPLVGPWQPGAPVGKAGRGSGAHLQLTLPPGHSQVLCALLPDRPRDHTATWY